MIECNGDNGHNLDYISQSDVQDVLTLGPIDTITVVTN